MAILLIFVCIFPELFYAADDTFARAILLYPNTYHDVFRTELHRPHSSSHATSDAVTALSIEKTATGSSLVRTILESYSKKILESASEQFLDLVVEMRLQTISASQLVKLLAKANRLGYQETDIVDDENDTRPVQRDNANLRSKPDATETPKPPTAITGQYRPHSIASSQPLSLEKSRAPNRTNTAQVQRDELLSVDAHLNPLEAQSAALSGKEDGYSIQSIQSISLELVVISDSEPEPEDDDDH